MRQAAVRVTLVPDTIAGRDRIQFVAEGEASLHYCIEENHLDDVSTIFNPYDSPLKKARRGMKVWLSLT